MNVSLIRNVSSMHVQLVLGSISQSFHVFVVLSVFAAIQLCSISMCILSLNRYHRLFKTCHIHLTLFQTKQPNCDGCMGVRLYTHSLIHCDATKVLL